MSGLFEAQFWLSLLEIIGVNIVLSGDNAVVIALAARSLPAHQQKKAIVLGSAAAILMRVLLTIFAIELLKFSYLKLIGSVLLIWIGIQLLLPEGDGEADFASKDTLLAAIKTILVADLVMSLDNVMAIAGAAATAGEEHQLILVIFGLLVSIPLIIGGSQLILKLMDRFPFIITLGGMLLGWIAASMVQTDPVLASHMPQGALWHYGIALLGAVLVFLLGGWFKQRAHLQHGSTT